MDDRAIEELLRRRAGPTQAAVAAKGASLAGAGGAACGDPELLAAYAEGLLAGPQREGFEQHLAACGACREAVARLVRLAPREAAAPAEPAQPAPAWWTRWAWAAPALAGMVLVGSLTWFGRQQIQQPQPSPPAQLGKVQEPPPAPPKGQIAGQTSAEALAGGRPAPRAGAGPDQAPVENRRARLQAPGTPSAGPAEEFAPSPEAPASAAVARDKAEVEAQLRVQPKAAAKEELAAKDDRAADREKSVARNEADTAAARPLEGHRGVEEAQVHERKTQALDETAGRRSDNLAVTSRMARPVSKSAPAPAAQEAGKAGASTPARASAPRAGDPGAGRNGVVAGTAGGFKQSAVGKAKAPAEGPVLQRQTVGNRQVWILTQDGGLFNSADGGQTWRQLAVPEIPRSFSFADDQSGEIVARSGWRYSTSDGGNTWKKAQSQK